MPTIVEYGDKAAEYASYLLNHGQCTAEAAVDFKLRTERLVTSFVSSYWRNVACRSTTTDRALSDCLVANLQFTANSTKLGDLSVGQFAMCLNAKFIASRRWDQLSAPGRDVPRVRLFRPEIREPCERFTGVQHLLDLTATGDDDVDDRVFGSSHVEHMEPYVMTQRVVEYASRYCRHQVRYFALTDTLVFKFTDGAPGDLIEKHYNHRFAGPKDFRDFHFELFNTAEFFRHDDNDGDSNHPRLPADDYPNAFVYREFGYSDMDNNIMNYVSVNGETTVCVESYRLNGTSQISGDNCDLKYEQRNRVKVKFGKFWLAVHGIGTSAVELTVGLHDGAMITVTTSKYGDRVFHDEGFDVVYRRTDSGFQVYEGDVQYTWPDGRPLLVCDYPIVEVEAADGTKTIVDFVNSVCRVHVSDGAKLRVRFCTASGVEFCHPGAAITNIGDGGPSSAGRQHCKYLVCRRDMSGYEFVESDQSSAWPPHAASVIRTLTRSCFDGQTSRLVNELLIDYLKTDEMLAYQLNAEFSEDSESGLEKSSQIDEEECWGGSGVFDF
ncbi:Hypothetical protein CINCED_3A008944 [Cinara cedri]|uniref:Uncharacterized protein n=1 Tax=Cinara cedri TaxID=506608 RepID=A0A5E4M5Q0_9HEMI|nr:Hypothetical protein CINCED_3A008944 [Cinara cedri]